MISKTYILMKMEGFYMLITKNDGGITSQHFADYPYGRIQALKNTGYTQVGAA